MNDLYVGAFHQFYTVWRTQHKTIMDSGFVLAGSCQLANQSFSAYLQEKNPLISIRIIHIKTSCVDPRVCQLNDFDTLDFIGP